MLGLGTLPVVSVGAPSPPPLHASRTTIAAVQVIAAVATTAHQRTSAALRSFVANITYLVRPRRLRGALVVHPVSCRAAGGSVQDDVELFRATRMPLHVRSEERTHSDKTRGIASRSIARAPHRFRFFAFFARRPMQAKARRGATSDYILHPLSLAPSFDVEHRA